MKCSWKKTEKVLLYEKVCYSGSQTIILNFFTFCSSDVDVEEIKTSFKNLKMEEKAEEKEVKAEEKEERAESLYIGSFNIQRFGQKKMNDKFVLDYLFKVSLLLNTTFFALLLCYHISFKLCRYYYPSGKVGSCLTEQKGTIERLKNYEMSIMIKLKAWKCDVVFFILVFCKSMTLFQAFIVLL